MSAETRMTPLPPREPPPPPWPGWTGVRPLHPGPALAALIADRTAHEWPYWFGARPGPDHTKHDKHPDREGRL